jgi:hypothetical protein
VTNDGMRESLFHGTFARDWTEIRALGAEVFEFAEERIKETRDDQRGWWTDLRRPLGTDRAGNFLTAPFRLYR